MLAVVAALLLAVTCDAFSTTFLVPRAMLPNQSHQPQRPHRGRQLSMTDFEMPHVTKRRKKFGFGGGKAKKPETQGKTFNTGEGVARYMFQEYNAIKADGGEVARVHARLKEGPGEWLPVGYVCTEPGLTPQGTQGQKRLILDHAEEMYTQLRAGGGKKLILEVGYGPEDGDEGDVTLCKGVEFKGEKVGVALDPLPEGPYFRKVAKGGFGADMSSAATLLDKKKYT